MQKTYPQTPTPADSSKGTETGVLGSPRNYWKRTYSVRHDPEPEDPSQANHNLYHLEEKLRKESSREHHSSCGLRRPTVYNRHWLS